MQNAYEMLELFRDNIGEATAAHWSDKLLLRRLNVEQLEVGRLVIDSPGDWLLKKSASITPVASVITLPSDCLRPAYIEEVASGRQIPIRGTIRERRMGRQPGTSLSVGLIEAYFYGAFLEVNMENYGQAVYVWYQPRIVDLHAGKCGPSTDETHVHFESEHWPNGTDDYYKDVVVEVRDSSSHVLNVGQAITTYVGATFLATVGTVAVTPESGDFYGTVSVLPKELLGWVVLRATVKALARPSSTFEKELFSFWRAELKVAKEEAEQFLATRLSGSTYTRIVEDY